MESVRPFGNKPRGQNLTEEGVDCRPQLFDPRKEIRIVAIDASAARSAQQDRRLGGCDDDRLPRLDDRQVHQFCLSRDPPRLIW